MKRQLAAKKKKPSKAQAFISKKIEKINKEGLRGKPPAPGQAAAVAYSMARDMGMKVPRPPKK